MALTSEQMAFVRRIEECPDDRTARGVYADYLDELGEHELAAFHRAFGGAGGFPLTGDEFAAGVIAQDDDGDYSESGYVACVFDKGGARFACLGNYCHCSCFDTWSSLCGGGISDYYPGGEVKLPKFTWVGPVAHLVSMAARGADPALPSRASAPADHDHDHLMKVYEGVLEWARRTGELVPGSA